MRRPHQMFRCEGGHCPRANKLILRLQPNEGIVLKFGMKVPGQGFDVKQVMMDFSYSDLGGLPTRRRVCPLDRGLHTGRPDTLYAQRCRGRVMAFLRPRTEILAGASRGAAVRLSRRNLGSFGK